MNWDKIEQLLNIVDKSLGHGVKLQGITNAALAELAKHNEESQGLKKQPASILPGAVTRVKEPEPELQPDPVRRREVPQEVE